MTAKSSKKAKQTTKKATAKPGAKSAPPGKATRTSRIRKRPKPVLLSGGNPQIEKGDGEGPVQAYLAAMPGWKRQVGRLLDALIERTIPNVAKAVRWNSPFYGIAEHGWFLSYHCFTKYIKVTFLRGRSLHPPPPIGSKHPDTRYFHIYEDDELDEELLTSWIRQASELPGDRLF